MCMVPVEEDAQSIVASELNASDCITAGCVPYQHQCSTLFINTSSKFSRLRSSECIKDADNCSFLGGGSKSLS